MEPGTSSVVHDDNIHDHPLTEEAPLPLSAQLQVTVSCSLQNRMYQDRGVLLQKVRLLSKCSSLDRQVQACSDVNIWEQCHCIRVASVVHVCCTQISLLGLSVGLLLLPLPFTLTPVTTCLHLIPTLLPHLPPGEGTLTCRTDLGWEMLLGNTSWHDVAKLWPSGRLPSRDYQV